MLIENLFYCKSRVSRQYNNVFNFRINKRNCSWYFARSHEGVVNLFYLNLVMSQYNSVNVKFPKALNFHQILLVVLMTWLIFQMIFYKLVYKFQSFVRLLQIIYQLIWNYQKLSKIAKSREFLGRLLELLLKTVSSLMKIVL